MESVTVSKFMRLVAPLSTELKLEILSKLSESLRADFRTEENKDHLLDELFGAWSETDENLAKEIIGRRTTSDRDVSFD